ncbi:MAG: hypothetical protein R2873_18670 [Caldilineaceae bacterium]
MAVIAITDHDTAEGAPRRASRQTPQLDIDVIVGQEVSTDEGDVLALLSNRRFHCFVLRRGPSTPSTALVGWP